MGLTKSEQIRAGLQKSFQSGTSAKASTVCYGYKVSRTGELVIDSAKADTVLFIFHHFMNGDSLGKISDALTRKGIVSPTGRAIWSRETISKLLSNEKYVGDVILGKTQVINGVQVKLSNTSHQVYMRGHHPAIIPHELFDSVQKERCKRSKHRAGSR